MNESAFKNGLQAQMDVIDEQRRTYGRPWLSYTLAAICVVYWIVVCVGTDISLLYRLWGADLTADQSVAWGAFSKQLVLQGQVWRIVTAEFLHMSTFHLISNVAGLIYVFAIAEQFLGWKKLLAACLVSSILYTIVMLLTGPAGLISAGISGWVMAGVGVLAGYQIYFYPVIPQRRVPFWLVFAGVIILSALSDRVMGGDTAGHMIGVGTSFVLTFYVFFPRIKAPQNASRARRVEVE